MSETKHQKLILPSNKKFGFFFVAVFLGLGLYFYLNSQLIFVYLFGFTSCKFLIITLIKDSLLLPLNKSWMRFGILLGKIVNPIVLGIIFFALFTPIAIVMRFFGRDELRLKLKEQDTHWVYRETDVALDLFKQQF